MRWINFPLSIILTLHLFSVASVAAEKKNQLEELLIWKMSEELKLTPVEEKKFSDIVKKLNEKKGTLNRDLQHSVEKMGALSKSKLKEEELNRYRKLTQNYGRLGEEEFDQLKGLLGVDRMARYLQVKQDLTNRIKTMLSNPESSKGGQVLPPPQLIEEK